MKLERFPFIAMVAALLLQGTGLAAHTSPALKQATSQSSEKSGDQQKDEVRNAKDQTRTKPADENREQSADVMRIISKRPPIASHSKPVSNHQPPSAKTLTTKGGRTEAPGRVAAPGQTGSKANVPNEAVSHRPSGPASAVSLNGQQFKNSRDPGARLAVSGGRLTSPTGTAVINGTNMKRKP